MIPAKVANPNSDVTNITKEGLLMADKRGVNNLEQTEKVDQLATDQETADFPRVNSSTTMDSPYHMDPDAGSEMSLTTSPSSQ